METVLHHFLGLLIYPANPIMYCLVGGFILVLLKKRTLGRVFMGMGIVYFILVGVTPLGPYTLSFLENRFPVPATLPFNTKGFIILGGSFHTPLSSQRTGTSYTRAAGRFYEALRVTGRYPTLPILFSGGGVLGEGIKTESQMAQEILKDLHIPLDRFLFEGHSKNTWENATLSFKMMHPQPQEPWVLMTSAVHMPRAVENFRRAGWHVIPYCVDYISAPHPVWDPLATHKNMVDWASAMRELTSLTRDFILGRSDVWIPSP